MSVPNFQFSMPCYADSSACCVLLRSRLGGGGQLRRSGEGRIHSPQLHREETEWAWIWTRLMVRARTELSELCP